MSGCCCANGPANESDDLRIGCAEIGQVPVRCGPVRCGPVRCGAVHERARTPNSCMCVLARVRVVFVRACASVFARACRCGFHFVRVCGAPLENHRRPHDTAARLRLQLPSTTDNSGAQAKQPSLYVAHVSARVRLSVCAFASWHAGVRRDARCGARVCVGAVRSSRSERTRA